MESYEKSCGSFLFRWNMAAKKAMPKGNKQVSLDLGEANAKQARFYNSKTLYTAYGGARGGGKSHAVRTLAIKMALEHAGIRILIVRRTYKDVEENHIEPILQKVVPLEIANYKGDTYTLTFINGSIIKFGHYQGTSSNMEYQGKEYDVIFIDEATQFCVHPDTELLLERGWTRVDHSFAGDRVLSLNPDGTQEYKTIENMFCFPSSGTMYENETRNGARFCVTPNHKIPVLDKVNGGWKFKQVQDIKDDYIARVGDPINRPIVEWFTDLPHHFKGHNEADKIHMNDWLEFLGWYLSEGCAFVRGDNGKTPRISIRQTKPAPTLMDLLERLPFRYSFRKEGQYIIYSGQLFDILKPLGNTYEKRVPQYVFDLDSSQIDIFLRAFELGDGHIKNGAINIGLANEGLIDDLQRLYTLTGRISCKGYSKARGQYDVYRLSVGQIDKRYTRSTHSIHEKPYDGLVWCPSVDDNHNFVMRYNGSVSVTGNTETEFRMFGGCCRGVNQFPKRIYLTCNPGGIGHQWVKRLFIDRKYKTDSDNPEENESPEDYTFIAATVEDNEAMQKASPQSYKQYLQMLSALPENIRKAHRYGDWDALGGCYFPEFSEKRHVIDAFPIPREWVKYRSFDYGLDALACYWIAVDPAGRSYVYREIKFSELIVSEAADRIKENTQIGERIAVTFAPPDMWTTMKDTGKTMAEVFMQNGINIVKSSNSRVQGHLQIKEMLSDMPERDKPKEQWKPYLVIFRNCKELISDLQAIQADEKNPNDCAKQPHEITHTIDGLRYYCVNRVLPANESLPEPIYEEPDEHLEDYDEFMTGGEATAAYLAY